MALELKTISAHEDGKLDAAYQLIAMHSWSEDELKTIDLKSELRKICVYRAGLFDDNSLVGFVAIATGASPDKVDNDQLWIGYLVIHPKFRYNRNNIRSLYLSCLEYVRANEYSNGGRRRRLFTCSETPSVQRALRREGWTYSRTADIIGDNGEILGEKTEVFEFIFPGTTANRDNDRGKMLSIRRFFRNLLK
jgi:hypothetical protein